MKLSFQKREKLYESIHDPIMDLRVKLKMSGGGDAVDFQIAQLEHKIWDNIKKVLKLENKY